jgi:hypothetical protein
VRGKNFSRAHIGSSFDCPITMGSAMVIEEPAQNVNRRKMKYRFFFITVEVYKGMAVAVLKK